MTAALAFEWDDGKAAANITKHGVAFEYAVRVFLDPDMVAFDASRSAEGETRYKAVGKIEARLFVLVYTDRGEARRVISARRANTKEQKAYGPLQT